MSAWGALGYIAMAAVVTLLVVFVLFLIWSMAQYVRAERRKSS